jgi:hypothetical protein
MVLLPAWQAWAGDLPLFHQRPLASLLGHRKDILAAIPIQRIFIRDILDTPLTVLSDHPRALLDLLRASQEAVFPLRRRAFRFPQAQLVRPRPQEDLHLRQASSLPRAFHVDDRLNVSSWSSHLTVLT